MLAVASFTIDVTCIGVGVLHVTGHMPASLALVDLSVVRWAHALPVFGLAGWGLLLPAQSLLLEYGFEYSKESTHMVNMLRSSCATRVAGAFALMLLPPTPAFLGFFIIWITASHAFRTSAVLLTFWYPTPLFIASCVLPLVDAVMFATVKIS